MEFQFRVYEYYRGRRADSRLAKTFATIEAAENYIQKRIETPLNTPLFEIVKVYGKDEDVYYSLNFSLEF